jgi:hypothetical protein
LTDMHFGFRKNEEIKMTIQKIFMQVYS